MLLLSTGFLFVRMILFIPTVFSRTDQILFTVLHPLFKDEYFKLANWEPDWIAEAIRLAQEMWISFYKPQPPSIPLIPSASSSKASHLFLLK